MYVASPNDTSIDEIRSHPLFFREFDSVVDYLSVCFISPFCMFYSNLSRVETVTVLLPFLTPAVENSRMIFRTLITVCQFRFLFLSRFLFFVLTLSMEGALGL